MRANGIDFSYWVPHYEHRPGSIDFVIHRLAHGITEDPRLAQHAAASVDVPVREGYIYYEMDSPWLAQVELAVELAQEHNLVNVWWDAEEDPYRNKFSRRFANETAEAIRYLRKDFPDAGLYCNRDMYFLLTTVLPKDWLANVPLWIADPRHSNTIDEFIAGEGEPNLWVYRGRYIDFERDNWTYWQTSFLGDPERYGITGKKAVDEDVFNGTREDLLELREVEDVEPPVANCCDELLDALQAFIDEWRNAL